MKRMILLSLAVFLFGVSVTAGLGIELNVPQIYQEKSQWCWAASCEAVLIFYGIDPTQTNLAIYGTGGNNVWNYLWGQGNPGDGIFRRGCDLIIDEFGDVDGNGFTGTLSPVELQAEMDALRPVFINWEWDGGGGHILLAKGMVGSNVYLMDPWYGPSLSDYDWVVSGSSHTWKWTIQINTESLATNSVPRWWLGQNGLTNGWNWDDAALQDPDSDGVVTWREYIADTQPTNAGSCFQLGRQLVQNGGAGISWATSTSRLYTLERAEQLSAPATWTNIPGWINITGVGSSMVYTNMNASNSFYRVKVEIP